jgi:hypothetical protein
MRAGDILSSSGLLVVDFVGVFYLFCFFKSHL